MFSSLSHLPHSLSSARVERSRGNIQTQWYIESNPLTLFSLSRTFFLLFFSSSFGCGGFSSSFCFVSMVTPISLLFCFPLWTSVPRSLNRRHQSGQILYSVSVLLRPDDESRRKTLRFLRPFDEEFKSRLTVELKREFSLLKMADVIYPRGISV